MELIDEIFLSISDQQTMKGTEFNKIQKERKIKIMNK